MRLSSLPSSDRAAPHDDPSNFIASHELAWFSLMPKEQTSKIFYEQFPVLLQRLLLQNKESSLILREERPGQESLIPTKARHH